MKEIIEFYNTFNESGRITEEQTLEYIRTKEIISRYLDNFKTVLDIGGAAGAYSFWLASLGFSVSLIDIVPKHIEQAKEYSAQSGITLSSAEVGNALELPYAEDSYDIVLLMGPLYHLQKREDRITAIREAKRVLRPNGYLFIAAITRFAGIYDGFLRGMIEDEKYCNIINRDLEDGKHTPGNTEYFTTSFFHKPEELLNEISEVGFEQKKIIAVEGFAGLMPNIDEKLKDQQYREKLLSYLKRLEEEESLMGASIHFLAVCRGKVNIA